MKRQNPKNSVKANPLEGSPKSHQLQYNKVSQSYRSYFFRNPKQVQDPSQSQSSQTNKLSKTKQRLKSTRVKSKNPNGLYYELESTKNDRDQALRQENVELRETIAQLKISQLYQIDEKKLLSLLKEIDDLKEDLKGMRKENQKLKLQNDFLNRSNFQLKLELNRLKKKETQNQKSQSISKQFKSLRLGNQSYGLSSPHSSMQIPEHLLLSNKIQKFQTRNFSKTPVKNENIESQDFQSYFNTKYNIDSLSRVHSDRDLIGRQFNSQSRKSQRTAMFTEPQNNQFLFNQ